MFSAEFTNAQQIEPQLLGRQTPIDQTYKRSLFVGELTRLVVSSLSDRLEKARQKAKPLFRLDREQDKHFQTLYTCSEILHHRPFSAFVFAFMFTKEMFTFFAYTREEIIYFEIKDWCKEGAQVMDAMQFLMQTPLDALIGRPTFQMRFGHEDSRVVLGECTDILNSAYIMLAHHKRNFGRSTAVYHSNKLGEENKIIKFAHLAIDDHKRSAGGLPVPVEVLIMQHLSDVFKTPAMANSQLYKSRFPDLEAWAVSPRMKYPHEQTQAAPPSYERELCAILMSGAGVHIGRQSIKGVRQTFEYFIEVFESELLFLPIDSRTRDRV